MLDQRGQLLRNLKAVVGSCGCALLLGACAIANTPQQDLAYARWAGATRRSRLCSSGSISMAGSRSGSPVRGAKRSCNASPKLAARGHCFPNLLASAPRKARDRSTRPATRGGAGLPRPAYDRSLWALRTWLDSWAGIGHVVVGMHRQGYDLQLTRLRRARLAGDVLPGRDGALAKERDRHRVGQHAVARDAAGGVGGAGLRTPPIVRFC